MGDNIFFDDDQYEELTQSSGGEFNFLIHQLTKDNAKSVALDLMSNGQSDSCLRGDGIITYIVVQLPPSKGDIVEWLEDTRVKHLPEYSNLTNNIYLKGAIKKRSPDGLVSTIDNIKSLNEQMKTQSNQNITINQGGSCIDCKSKIEIDRLRALVDEQSHTINNLSNKIALNIGNIASELGITETEVVCMFKGNPTYAQKLFMATGILHTDSEEEFNSIFEHAKLFSEIEEVMHRDELVHLLTDLHCTVNALDTTIALATNPMSDAGAKISEIEWPYVNKLVCKTRRIIASITKKVSDLRE